MIGGISSLSCLLTWANAAVGHVPAVPAAVVLESISALGLALGLVAARLPERSRVIESIAKKAGRHHAQVTKNFKEEKLCFRLHSGPDADHM